MLSNSKNIVYVDIDDIKIPSLSKRDKSDVLAETVFARGIRSTGIQEPFLIMKIGESYELVDGTRRLETMKRLGNKVIPCIVDEGYDESYGSKARYRNYLRFIVNYHRQDLPKSQKIYFINMAIRKYKVKLSDISQILGTSDAVIRKHLEIEDASNDIKEMVDNNIITIGSALKLKKLNSNGLKRIISQIDTTTRISEKTINYLVKELDPEIHFKDMESAKRFRNIRLVRQARPSILTKMIEHPTPTATHRNIILDDIYIQNEKMSQLEAQMKSFRLDLVIILPVIKQIMENKETYNALEPTVAKGFKEYLNIYDKDKLGNKNGL